MDYKLVVAVREDLGLSRGKLAVQVAHAAVMAALATRERHPRWFRAWWKEGQKKVVVGASGLEELQDLERRARDLDLVAKIVEDAGLTELPPGTTTCLGIGPGPNGTVDRVTRSLKLV